jgi:hypothetical protein
VVAVAGEGALPAVHGDRAGGGAVGDHAEPAEVVVRVAEVDDPGARPEGGGTTPVGARSTPTNSACHPGRPGCRRRGRPEGRPAPGHRAAGSGAAAPRRSIRLTTDGPTGPSRWRRHSPVGRLLPDGEAAGSAAARSQGTPRARLRSSGYRTGWPGTPSTAGPRG